MTGNLNHTPSNKQTAETYDIRIARDGSWWHEGAMIERPGLVRLFASVLQRDEAGAFWLITPAERGRIVVEDAPFVAVEMTVSGSGRDQILRFRSNLDEWVTAGKDHPLECRNGKIYVLIRTGLEALLARAVYYDLVELAEDGAVWSSAERFGLSQERESAS